jgi:adenosine deaminase
VDLRTLPKAELHRHLEGSIRLATIIDLSREAGVPLPAETPEELAAHARILEPLASLDEALKRFSIAQNSVRSPDAVRRIALEAVEDLAADGIRLAELRFSPDFLCRPGGLDWDAALDAILQGLDEAKAAGQDVAVGLIAIVSRDYGMDSARRTVEWTLRHREQFVGFDLAGSEAAYPPRMFAEVLAPIRDAGLPLTAHYGESAGPEYPREAIEVLGVARLGHGVSIRDDPEVLALARDRGVTIEACPTSNWLTRAVTDPADHPARRMLEGGVSVTINTDDPELFGIDLTHELELARHAIGFSDDDIRHAIRNAVEASFLPEDVKAEVRARWFEGRLGAPGPS